MSITFEDDRWELEEWDDFSPVMTTVDPSKTEAVVSLNQVLGTHVEIQVGSEITFVSIEALERFIEATKKYIGRHGQSVTKGAE